MNMSQINITHKLFFHVRIVNIAMIAAVTADDSVQCLAFSYGRAQTFYSMETFLRIDFPDISNINVRKMNNIHSSKGLCILHWHPISFSP